MQAQIKKDGLSLKKTSIIMMIVSLIITVILVITAIMTIRSFQAMNKSTRDFIRMEIAAHELMDASDYLTEEVQCFTVMGDRTHMENYFTEADITRRRENAIQVMEETIPDSPALTELKAGMAESLSLMNREYYAMRLMLDAAGDTDIPAALQDVRLTEEDLALDADAKVDKARMMMHDTEYYAQKSRIRENMQECVDTLTGSTQKVRDEMQAWTNSSLKWMIILLVVQSV